MSLQLINTAHLHQMTQAEKAIYTAKLRAEIDEFKQREVLYTEKRQELLDLEQKLRQRTSNSVVNDNNCAQKLATDS